MTGERICVIPGSFDPVTNGHVDIIRRAAELFDKVYAAVFDNSAKQTMFSPEERLEMLRLACADLDNVTADATSELIADYAGRKRAGFLVKGVRGMTDYEYEHNLFFANREISKNKIETIFFPSKTEYMYLSSAFVREMIKYKRDISTYVPLKTAEFVEKWVEKQV